MIMKISQNLNLAMLLERVNKQIFKLKFKNSFYFIYGVLFAVKLVKVVVIVRQGILHHV